MMAVWKETECEHVEVGQPCRESGEVTGRLTAGSQPIFECVVSAADLNAEMKEALRVSQSNHRVALLAVMNRDRSCPKFFQHRRGFTPKEHVQMMLTEEMVQAQRNLLAEEKKANDERRKEDARVAEERRKSDRRWNIGQAAVLAVFTAILAAVLAVLVEPWKERAKQGVQPVVQTGVVP